MAVSKHINILSIVSYNMHGFNQGCVAIDELINKYNPDIFFCQEHWLCPANLHRFDDHFSGYFSFGSSAMAARIESGILFGRPFGGVTFLIKKCLRTCIEKIHSDERYAVIKIGNYLCFNVYFPCVGTRDRFLLCEALLNDIWSWIQRYQDCKYIIAGDFNTDLNSTDNVAQQINSFINSAKMCRCDALFPLSDQATYVNVALNQQSYIDYFLTSSHSDVLTFDIIDPDINFSDHLPIMMSFNCAFQPLRQKDKTHEKNYSSKQKQLRWDKADLISYYLYTGQNLQSILQDVQSLEIAIDNDRESTVHNDFDISIAINTLYNNLIFVLNTAAGLYVPEYKKNFCKFWWNENLTALKQAAIESNKMWKAAGKPKQGPIFSKRQSCRAQYRKAIHERQKSSKLTYTNDLHEALLVKDGPTFWRCWRSKFEVKRQNDEVDGCIDDASIACNFADYFSKIYTPNCTVRAENLLDEYTRLRQNYFGLPYHESSLFDTEQVSKVVADLHCGRAPGIDGIMAEHLMKAHPVLCVILSKFFRLIYLSKCLPNGFCSSYIVPIPKSSDSSGKKLVMDDFRGIAISPIISKVFEYCLVEKLEQYLRTDEKQFGFKKGLGCNHAIYTVRQIVERYIKGGNTANLCALDLSKAFDKVNHHALLTKLMKRNLPVSILELLERTMENCYCYVKWNAEFSDPFLVQFGVRQGSVLSPFLFAVYIDDIASNLWPRFSPHSYLLLYADDILLIAPSIQELQSLLNVCEIELIHLDMLINVKKSHCIRIGPRCDVKALNIVTSSGQKIPWSNEIRYLGSYILQSRQFKCSLVYAKRSFHRSLNTIFSKVGGIASEEVVLELVRSKCLPILLYSLECYRLTKSDLKSLDFSVVRFLMKLFKTSNNMLVNECRSFFGFLLPSELLQKRIDKFVVKYNNYSALLYYFNL